METPTPTDASPATPVAPVPAAVNPPATPATPAVVNPPTPVPTTPATPATPATPVPTTPATPAVVNPPTPATPATPATPTIVVDAPSAATPADSGRKTQSKKAQLHFPVSRIKKNLRKMEKGKRISSTCPVYMAAVLEYLTAEILEIAGNCAMEHKHVRITPRDLKLAIDNDEELRKLMTGTIIPCSGTVPNIHNSLLPKTKKKAAVVEA